jgi:hypothetical protein
MRAVCRLLPSFRTTFFLLLILAGPGASRAQDVEGAARSLAQKIASIAGSPGTLVLTGRNLSSLGAVEFAAARRALEAELVKHGFRIVKAPPADLEVRATLAENVQGFLWVAEFHRGETEQVAMASVQGTPSPEQVTSAPLIALQKNLVWEQPAPILDFALMPQAPDSAPLMLVLELERVALYRLDGSHWQFQEALSIPHGNSWPRDLRGRLLLRDESFEAYLPGASCAGLARRNLAMECRHDEAAKWPLDVGGEPRVTASFEGTRNFFTGFVTAHGEKAEKLPPFFSAATLKAPSVTDWVFTGLDGQARFYDGELKPEATFSHWGSDIVAIAAGCGAPYEVLATRESDWTQPDAIQTFEIVEHEAVAVGQAVEFAGPVTALWPAADGKNAVAVSHNLKTGQYEAFTLSIACGH